MSAVRRRGLRIDDPLGPSEPAEPDKTPGEAGTTMTSGELARRPAQTTDHPSEAGQRGEPRSEHEETGTLRRTVAPAPQAASREVWRAWSGITGVGSFRLPHELLVELGDSARELGLPHELLVELGDSARELGLPIGMIVTAAITQLLDHSPEQIAELVDRADDARIHGRRNARRRLIERSEG
jgi:hypothetical protein